MTSEVKNGAEVHYFTAPSLEWSLTGSCRYADVLMQSLCTLHLQGGEVEIQDIPEDVIVPANAEPVDGVATQDVVVDEASDVWVRLFFPVESQLQSDALNAKSTKSFPVIFYCHGGGFYAFSPATEL